MNRCSLMLKNIATGNLLRSLSKNIHVAYYADASCPSISLLARLSCVSREKSLVHTVCTCLVTPGFGNFYKICFVALTSVRPTNFSSIKMPATAADHGR